MHKLRKTKKSAFTLIEITIVATILGVLMPSILSTYNFIVKSNREISARQTVIQQGYEFLEKLNILMQDYTIDYEEYFNRQMVGCTKNGLSILTGENFQRYVGEGGYCKEFTAYGNHNSTNRSLRNGSINTEWRDIYYCSSTNSQNRRNVPRVVRENCGKRGYRQSFGQYKALFTDVKSGLGGNIVGDSDDVELGFAPYLAIRDVENIQEIYLISHDGKNRLYFRRKLVNQEGEHLQYKIQMLRLKGFDAGQKHSFNEIDNNEGLYDGKIDTWACDSSMGFIGNGDSIGGIYEDYRMPRDVDDCWVDLTQGQTTIHARKIKISPSGDADLFWSSQNHQINAYMKILVVNGVYLGNYDVRSISRSIGDFKVPLQTTINMKDFYKE